MKKAIYAGSFDPITSGHVDIIKRGAKVFDKIYVVLMENTTKSHLFSLDERVRFLKESIKDLGDRVEVDVYTGLIADYCNIKDTYILIRGLRALTDFEYEFQMALMNTQLDPNIETLFMMTSSEYSYLSSSSVKQVAKFGGNIKGLVPDEVITEVINKINGLGGE